MNTTTCVSAERALLLALALLATGTLGARGQAAGPWYVTTNGLDSNAGTSWTAAFQSVTQAVSQAVDGDTIYVSNGVYQVTTQVLLSAGVRLVGVNGWSNTVVERAGGAMHRVFKLTHTNAVLEGLTIRKGGLWGYVPDADLMYGAGVRMDAGTITNCYITDNRGNRVHGGDWTRGGGVFMADGLLVDSIVHSNSWYHDGGQVINFVSGGGIYMTGGTVRRCVVSANKGGTSQTHQRGMDGGGGIRMTGGAVENCLVIRNQTGKYNGGGVLMSGAGRLVNCTVADNTVIPGQTGTGAGVRRDGGAITNCVIYHNLGSGGTADNLVGAGAVYSCATELTSGEGNQTADPLFVNRAETNYRPASASTCIDGGTNLGSVAEDLDGNARPADGLGDGRAVHDLGCYEYVRPDVFACSFAATNDTVGYSTLTVGFEGYVTGPAGTTNNVYYAWDFGDGSALAEGWGLSQVAHAYGLGRFDVSLTVSNDLDDVTNATRLAYVRVAGDTAYVATHGTSAYPYEDWARAATNLADARNAVGDALTYGAASAVIRVGDGVFDLSAELLLDNNITVSSVNGYSNTTIRQQAPDTRVVYMTDSDAVLSGFTVRGGGHKTTDRYGAGIRMSAGTVTNCYITDNTGGGHGAPHYGGGLYMNGPGYVVDSVIYGNRHAYMGGAGAWMNNGTLERCVIGYNFGGRQHHAGDGGGGLRMSGSARVRNCLIYDNSTEYQDGGGVMMSGGTLESCTIVDNESGSDPGGGIRQTGGTVRNVIVYHNLNGGAAQDYSAAGGAVTYSCAPELAGGTGNTTAPPLFRNRPADDYRLKVCAAVNTGEHQAWMVDGLDLDHGPRIVAARVDMGCYEAPPSGAMVLIR